MQVTELNFSDYVKFKLDNSVDGNICPFSYGLFCCQSKKYGTCIECSVSKTGYDDLINSFSDEITKIKNDYTKYIESTLANMTDPNKCPFCRGTLPCVSEKTFYMCLGCNIAMYEFIKLGNSNS